jgi:hypothetical protein
VLGRRRPHLPLPKLGGLPSFTGGGVSGRTTGRLSSIRLGGKSGASWRSRTHSVADRGGEEDHAGGVDAGGTGKGGHRQHEDDDGAVAVLTSPCSGSGAQPAGDVLELRASVNALPQLNAVIAACWQQRELRRPTAVEAHAALQRLGLQLAGGVTCEK